MRKEFENNNYLEKEVVLNIRVPKEFNEDMERRIDEALADVLFNFGCELVDSKEYQDVIIPDIQNVDMSKLSFRDFDDTEMPVQYFFGYDVPKEQIQALASFWGYKGNLCQDVEIVMDLFSAEECPVEAVLTFTDKDQRWVDLRSTGNLLEQMLLVIQRTGTQRAAEALKLYQEITEMKSSVLPKSSLSSQIETAAAHAERLINSFEKNGEIMGPNR